MSSAGIPPGWYPDPSNAVPAALLGRRGVDRGHRAGGARAGLRHAGLRAPGYGAPAYGYGPPGYGAPGYGTTQVGYGYAQAVGAPLAGFWIRFGAYFADSMLLGVPANLILELSFDTTTFGPGDSIPATFWLLSLLLFAGQIAYFAYFEGTSGQTIGKKLCGIRVVDADSLQPGIGMGRGTGRFFARILSALVCYLGFFWMLWDPQKQTWHDKLARTKVVKDLK